MVDFFSHRFFSIYSKLIHILLILFIIGNFLSRSINEISKYLSLVVALAGIIIIIINQKKTNRKKIIFFSIWFFLIAVLIFWFSYQPIFLNQKIFFFFAMVFPIFLWSFYLYVDSLLTKEETIYWLGFNGFIIWFYISFFFRNINLHPDAYFRDIVWMSSSFTYPLTIFYIFLKQIKRSGKTQIKFSKLFLLAFICIQIMVWTGLFSFFGLLNNNDFVIGLYKKLDITYMKSRLASFYFVLDLGNLIGQAFFVSSSYFLVTFQTDKYKDRKKKILLIILSFALLIFLILTKMKLLVPIVLFLFLFYLYFILKAYRKDIIRKYFIYLLLITIIGITVFFKQNNLLRIFYNDFKKSMVIIKEDYSEKNFEEIFQEIVKNNLEIGISFTYRLQFHIWAWKIMLVDPWTGIAPFAFKDYTDNYFKKDIELQPDIVTKNKHPHSDTVTLIAGSGLIGFFLFFGMIFFLLYYYINQYRKTKNYLYLGLTFAILSMIGAGLTEPNFKSVLMHLLSFYCLFFLYDRLINHDEKTRV